MGKLYRDMDLLNSRSWIGGDDGVEEWRSKIQAVTQRYDKVLMLGDSMGGTGALLFSDLATAVETFTPQVGFVVLPDARRRSQTFPQPF